MRRGLLIFCISVGFALGSECKNYVVKEGDTLERIARREGVDIKDIKAANKGLREDKLRVGQSLCVPLKTKASEKYAVYEVKRGDTLEKVAKSFGVDVETLKEYNKLKSDRLVEGQKIKIPARGTARAEEGYDLQRRKGRLEDVAKATGVPKDRQTGTKVKVPKAAKDRRENYQLYTVKRGGRLEHVAKATGTPLKELERLNPTLKDKWLNPGTQVKVPQKEREVKTQEGYELYTLRRGGRLEDVAKATGVPKDRQTGTKVKVPEKEENTRAPQEAPNRKEERIALREIDKGNAPSPQLPTFKGLSLPLPVEGKVTRVPKGIEIQAPCSTPVRAVEEGRVIYSGGDLQAYGNMVIVEHEGFISLYAHNETNLVKRGEWVGKGQVIAKLGKRGGSEECVLRFELRNKEGIPLDPTEYIKSTN
ncbi:MAG: LysM peptidoglycan-binding domain-containing protein [Aquificaceae bacterium]|nr:LysM peptidoglycan-binding domain-containing protein [Aquificaceae bacterium]